MMDASATDRVTADEAFQILLPSMEPGEARVLLKKAIAADRVAFFSDGTKVPADMFNSYFEVIARPDAAGQWHVELQMLRAVQNFHETVWTFSRSGVLALLEETKPQEQVRGRKRGAKVKFDWDRLFAEVLRHVHDAGPPENDTDYANKLIAWCGSKNFGAKDIPEFDTIRSKLRIWFSLLRQHRN